jgi:hypothetical protein
MNRRYVDLLRKLLSDLGIPKPKRHPIVAEAHSDEKPRKRRTRKAWAQGSEFTEKQAIELLADWLIVPSPFRNQLVRSFYRFRQRFTLAMIQAEMTQRGYVISAEQIFEEMAPFLRRRLVVTLQQKNSVKRYRLSDPRVKNVAYAHFFFKKKRRRDKRKIPLSISCHSGRYWKKKSDAR